MSNGQIGACPECDAADVYTRRPTAQGSTANDDRAYRCQDCGATFDDPHYRERESSPDSIGKNTLARRLLDADPSEVGP